MSSPCGLATVTEINAVYFIDRLIIRAKGNKATPCHKVKIRRSPIDIFPPQYFVDVCATPQICIAVITPFDVVDVFIAPLSESIKVQTASGLQTVPVRVIRHEMPASVRLAGESDAVASTVREAVGYSETFDFREAFQDAVANLPPDPHPFPDKLVTVTVVETGAMFGGIAGVHKMFVRIKAH